DVCSSDLPRPRAPRRSPRGSRRYSARAGFPRSSAGRRCGSCETQQRVELPFAIEPGEIVGTADRLAVDEDLRHGHCIGLALEHLGPFRTAQRNVVLLELDALALEQPLGPIAVAAEHFRVDFDLWLTHADSCRTRFGPLERAEAKNI